MSWSITINNLQEFEGFDYEVIETMLTQHLMYPSDMNAALKAAKAAGLASCTLAGGRTPNPATNDEVVNIMITGMAKSRDFLTTMKEIVVQPDAKVIEERG